MYYIGPDVHRGTISYCVKGGGGAIHAEGTIPAERFDLDRWMRTLPQPWTAAMEGTAIWIIRIRFFRQSLESANLRVLA
jgi:transposase